MRSSQQLEAPPFASRPQPSCGHRRITLPLHRVLGFARQDLELRPSRQLAFALRPLLGLALTTTGLCPDQPPATSLHHGRRRSAGETSGEPETLISALSSLVEVVKLLTPDGGRVYARLGHETLHSAAGPGDGAGERDGRPERREPETARPAPRSEVVIELVSTAGAGSSSLPAQIVAGFGSLAFELAVVAAIVESKGGELYFGTPGGNSRSFIVRLPVYRAAAGVEGVARGRSIENG